MANLKNATVLITGGTGSFGRTVARKLLDEKEVDRVVVFSRDEKKQHDMRIEFNDKRLHFELGDVRDPSRVLRATKGSDFIFHAAALKHVPACEFFPMEAVKTNVIGTDNVIDAALYHDVQKVVVLSTDKAAYPINAMGCSKMLMEKIMIARAQAQSSNDKTILCGVRYGNVMFSRGSVLPLFVDQAKRGVSLTVTHPDMTRFLLPLSQAVDLVLHALREGRNGDLFIRKAKAASVLTMAQAVIAMHGAQNEIKTIGIRAGEKMHETLATSEELYRATDQGTYWRIPFEPERDDQRFFTEGNENIADIEDFTSHVAEQLTVDAITQIIRYDCNQAEI